MPIIRVTQKLQKEIGIKPSDLAVVPEQYVPFEEWYSHVFILDRKKQLIFAREIKKYFGLDFIPLKEDYFNKLLSDVNY